METWVEIVYNRNYKISNLGNVRRVTPSRTSKPGPIKPCNISKGYLAVWLPSSTGRGKNYLVHRLVAEAFLGDIPVGKEVNHKDGNKTNNHQDNLEYLSPSDNIRHAFRTGLNKGPIGEKSGSAKLTAEGVHLIRELLPNKSRSFLAKAFRVHYNTIEAIASNKHWKI